MTCTVGQVVPKKPLSKADVLGCDDVQIEKVPVPEWGGFLWVMGLSGTARDAFERRQTVTDKKGNRSVRFDNFRASLCAECIIEPGPEPGDDGDYPPVASGNGYKRMFLLADVKDLSKKSALALQRVFNKATKLSGMSEEDIEELVGNYDGDQNGDSG